MLPSFLEPMPLSKIQRRCPDTRIGRVRPGGGFSLIEMLVVLVIVSILLVVAVPIFSDASNQARRASAEIIQAHLRQARAHAITSGSPTAVAIPGLASGADLGARSLSLLEVESDQGTYVPRHRAAAGDRMLQRREVLPGDFHFVSGAAIGSARPTLVDQPASMVTRQSGRELPCHIMVFATDGRVVWPPPGTPIHIGIARATRRGDSLQLTQNNNGRPVFELFQVNRLTGRTRSVEP
jgi:prepilin-type N-terminal cleavage/methylation domain-containing protein